jgi:N-acetylated-alpha-linked acidic dipeptidase
VERFSDPGFRVGRTLAQVLGVSVMRLASATALPFRYSHYGRKIAEFLDTASTWSYDEDGKAVARLNLLSARRLAAIFTDRVNGLERRIDAALTAGTLTRERARTLNDRLVRLEQALLDESEPASARWYRHVIYGWNIYSLYEGQPLPGLAEAIRLRDQSRVDREVARIEAALTRLVDAVEDISLESGK